MTTCVSTMFAPHTRPAREFWQRYRRNGLGVLGLGVVILLIFMAFLAPWLAPHDPFSTSRDRFLPVGSPGHLLGTDHLGRDILSSIIWGARVSLLVGFAAAATAACIGIVMGAVSGYYGKVVDAVLMRVTELFQVIPRFVLALVVVAFFGSGLEKLILVIGILSWPPTARLVRSQFLSHKAHPYVDSARVLGMRPAHIMFREILPNVMPSIIVTVSLDVAQAILLEASLSFFGLGDPNARSWGGMLREAQGYMRIAWWMSVFPGLAILLAVVGFNLVGDAINEATNPKLREGGCGKDRLVVKDESAIASHQAGATPENPALTDAVLEIRDLVTEIRSARGLVWPVDGVSLRMHRGQAVGLVGESGSGKSMTAFSIIRLFPTPAARIVGGRIQLQGREIQGLPEVQMRRIRGREVGMVFQDPSSYLNPVLPVGLQIREQLVAHGQGRNAELRIASLLHQVNLSADVARRYPHELSGGMRQRVCIASAIACNPVLLVADEPTTALDVTVQAQILELLVRLQKELGMALLLITHDLGIVAEICDYVYVMYAGRIVEEGPVVEVFEQPRHPYTQGLLQAVLNLHEPRRARVTIPGTVPDLVNMPAGCRFHPRCPAAMSCCREAVPPTIRLGTVNTACWLYVPNDAGHGEKKK